MQLRKLSTAILFAGFVTCAFSQVTLVWNFGDDNAIFDTGTPANFSVSAMSIGNTLGTVADPVNSTSASNFSGASGTGNIGNAARVGALNTAASGSAFFEVTFTPTSGYALSITDFDFGARSTGTGAQAYALRSSLNGYSTDIMTGSITNNSTWALKNNATFLVSGAANEAVGFRLYVYGGAGSPGSGTINTRLDDIAITVSSAAVSAIPEPSTYAAIFGGLALVGSVIYRRRQAKV